MKDSNTHFLIDNDIREILSEFGEVKSLIVPQNTFFAKTFGKAIVEFDSDVAQKVLEVTRI